MNNSFFQLNRLVLLVIFLSITSQFEALAQPTKVAPISSFKSINSDDPLRFFSPADVGINAGDLNGDGIEEFINHTQFSADLSTSELGDFTDKTLICNYNDAGERTGCSVNSGNLLYPAGDLNNDGRDDLIAFKDGMVQVYTFPEEPVDVAELPMPTFVEQTSNVFQDMAPNHDVDGDGVEDLIMSSNNFVGDSFIGILFGNSNGASIELKEVNTTEILGNVDVLATGGDVIGDGQHEIIALTSSGFPCNQGASVFTVAGDRTVSHSSTTDLGTCSNSVRDTRFFVVNADGEGKDDLLYSDDRYSPGGGGFVRVFFNDPVSQIAYSTGSDPVFSQPRVLADNQTIDHVVIGDNISGNVGLAFTNRETLSICTGGDILSENEAGNEACSNLQTVDGALSGEDQIFPRLYSPAVTDIARNPNGGFFNGVLRQQEFAGGALLTDPGTLAIVSAVQSFFNIFSTFRNIEGVMPPNLVGSASLLIPTIGFSNGFLSVPTPVDVNLNILTDPVPDPGPVRGDVGVEPSKVFNCNGNDQCAVGPIFVDGFESGSASSWFNKANNTANEEVVTRAYRIDVSAFQALDDNSFISANNVGDINNDGTDDLVIASRFSTSSNMPINKIWIFYGEEAFSKTMPDVTIDLSQEESVSASDFTGVGTSIEGVGDVNGDGVDDFAVGLPGHVSNRGSVFVYFGEDSQNKSKASSQIFDFADVILAPDLDEGQSAFGFGNQFAGGDHNGDGFNDIAVITDSPSGSPVPPFISIFNGGSEMDNLPDLFPQLKKSEIGGDTDDPVTASFGSIIQFTPSENDNAHQDLLFIPGVFSGFPDAAIFHGGPNPDGLPDVQVCGPNQNTGFGFGNRGKAVAKDLNGDGFYEIVLVNELDNEDGFVSSRAHVYSPNSGITVSNEDEVQNPLSYRLSQNYPNPFNPSTNIEFLLPQASNVSLKVYDLLGREVATLLNNVRYGSGSQTVPFDASALSSGVYLYRLEAGSFVQTRKMTLIK